MLQPTAHCLRLGEVRTGAYFSGVGDRRTTPPFGSLRRLSGKVGPAFFAAERLGLLKSYNLERGDIYRHPRIGAVLRITCSRRIRLNPVAPDTYVSNRQIQGRPPVPNTAARLTESGRDRSKTG